MGVQSGHYEHCRLIWTEEMLATFLLVCAVQMEFWYFGTQEGTLTFWFNTGIIRVSFIRSYSPVGASLLSPERNNLTRKIRSLFLKHQHPFIIQYLLHPSSGQSPPISLFDQIVTNTLAIQHTMPRTRTV